MAFFDRAITGQLVSRITNDTEQIRQLYQQVLFEMLQGLTVLAGAIVAMAWLDWRLMLIVLTLMPATVGIIWAYQRLSAPAVTRTRELRSDINAQMAESIAGMGVLQATGAAARFARRFAETNDDYYGSRLGEMRANAWLLRPALDLFNVLLIVAVIAAFGTQQFGSLQVGLLYAFITYIARVVEPLIQITMQFSLLQQAMVAASRVNALLAEGGTPAVGASRRIEAGGVRLAKVTFGYDPTSRCCTISAWTSRPGASTASSATPAPARARCSRCCCASTRRRPAASRSTASHWPPSATSSSAPTSAWCRRIRSCWRRARARTSTWDGVSLTRRSKPPPVPPARTSSFWLWRTATTRRWARAGRGSPPAEAARRRGACVGRRAAHPVPRRGHLAHRQRNRAVGAARACRTARARDGDRDRAPPVDHSRGRSHRGVEPRPHREQGTHEELMAIDGGIYQRLYLLQQIGE